MTSRKLSRREPSWRNYVKGVSCAVMLLGIVTPTIAETYSTCAGNTAERQWNYVYQKCNACLRQGSCPPGCCYQKISTTQFYICEAPGCCLRFLQNLGVTPSAIVATENLAQLTASSQCAPVASRGSCSANYCALELQSMGLVTCPGGYNIPAAGSSTASSNCATTASSGSSASNATTSPDSTSSTTTAPPDTKSVQSPSPTLAPTSSSTPAPGSKAGSSACFPGSARVHLSSGRITTMDKLTVGDIAQVGPDEFSAIFMFTHKLSGGLRKFLEISTDGGQEVAISHSHFLYVNDTLAPASSVAMGDSLTLADGGATKVSSVRQVSKRGLYNPQTLHGDIVVDGIIVSTYTSSIPPAVAHASLLPLRAVYKATGVFVTVLEDDVPHWMRRRSYL